MNITTNFRTLRKSGRLQQNDIARFIFEPLIQGSGCHAKCMMQVV